jgi:predicted nucleic acid-binding protein
MLIYLDTVIVIYRIDGDPAFKARVAARLNAANAARDSLATSDLTRLECLIQPLRTKDVALQSAFVRFLASTAVLSLSPTVCDRAAQIRAVHNYSVADALHLAAATLGNCDRFLTNDAALARFPDIAVEMLP